MEHLEWHGISRERFLKGAGAALGAAVLGGGYASCAQAETVADPTRYYDGNPVNTTGSYAPAGARHLLRSDRPEVISLGFLPNRDAQPVLEVASGDVVTIEQISHEGILPDQGSPYSFFNSWGIPRSEILDDQIMVFEEVEQKGEGPHVVTGPVAIHGAEPGDWRRSAAWTSPPASPTA